MLDKNVTIGTCNLCDSESFVKIADETREGRHHKVYECTICNHVQLFPRPNLEEEKFFYDHDKQEKSVRKNIDIENLCVTFNPDILRRADFISHAFNQDSSLLDIGCGYGFFPEEMRKRGFNTQGIEVSQERRDHAKKVTSVEILNINLADKKLKHELERKDIVTMFHVLEHMADPISFAETIHTLLKKNGCFIVEVPNVDELMRETCPAYDAFYWTRPHLNYFSAKTLRMVLEKAGFKKIEILYVQRYGVDNLCNWLSTGKPQLERPILQIDTNYKWLEDDYRKRLVEMGKTDSLFALAYI